MSYAALDAALHRLRAKVFKREASVRRLAVPHDLDSVVGQLRDVDVWATILAHNSGLLGALRRFPLRAAVVWRDVWPGAASRRS